MIVQNGTKSCCYPQDKTLCRYGDFAPYDTYLCSLKHFPSRYGSRMVMSQSGRGEALKLWSASNRAWRSAEANELLSKQLALHGVPWSSFPIHSSHALPCPSCPLTSCIPISVSFETAMFLVGFSEWAEVDVFPSRARVPLQPWPSRNRYRCPCHYH